MIEDPYLLLKWIINYKISTLHYCLYIKLTSACRWKRFSFLTSLSATYLKTRVSEMLFIFPLLLTVGVCDRRPWSLGRRSLCQSPSIFHIDMQCDRGAQANNFHFHRQNWNYSNRQPRKGVSSPESPQSRPVGSCRFQCARNSLVSAQRFVTLHLAWKMVVGNKKEIRSMK